MQNLIDDKYRKELPPFDINDFGGLQENEQLVGDMIYCTVCSGKKLYVNEEFGIRVRCKCACEQEKQRKEEQAKQVDMLKKSSLLGKRYWDATFENTETGHNETFDLAYKRCKAYISDLDEVLRKGYGLYIYGDKGTGKTHLTACMTNEMISQLYKVLVTNFFEITKEIKKTYNSSTTDNESRLIENIANIDFLIIDDIGTETLTKNGENTWIQEKIYDVLNKRYNAQKPTIFTSNYSLRELVEDRGMMDKTVDRIMEMSTAIIKVEGQSYRKEMRKKNITLF